MSLTPLVPFITRKYIRLLWLPGIAGSARNDAMRLAA